MDVVAYLPRQLLNHLKIVLGSEHSLAVASNWSDLRTTVQLVVADLVVADPSASGTIDHDSLELRDRLCKGAMIPAAIS